MKKLIWAHFLLGLVALTTFAVTKSTGQTDETVSFLSVAVPVAAALSAVVYWLFVFGLDPKKESIASTVLAAFVVALCVASALHEGFRSVSPGCELLGRSVVVLAYTAYFVWLIAHMFDLRWWAATMTVGFATSAILGGIYSERPWVAVCLMGAAYVFLGLANGLHPHWFSTVRHLPSSGSSETSTEEPPVQG